MISTDFGDEPGWVVNVFQASTDKSSVCIYARVLVLIEVLNDAIRSSVRIIDRIISDRLRQVALEPHWSTTQIDHATIGVDMCRHFFDSVFPFLVEILNVAPVIRFVAC